MHSFITAIVPEIKIGPNVLEIKPDTSIGITEVREIQHFLSRKATQGSHIVLIYDAHLLTLPAQNALLKTLEEPPSYSQIYLITSFSDQLLPTVQSRCEIISSISSSEHDIVTLPSGSPADRLKWVEKQEFDRTAALKYLSDLEWHIHKNLTTKISYDLIANTRKYLNANCNVKLTMDIFALNL